MTACRRNSIYGYDHVYQITADRGICFYTSSDCLVWFTLLCVLARKYSIRILSVCIMLNHYHIQLRASSALALSSFMRDLTARFTRAYNRRYGISGRLFLGQFCNASKNKENKIKDNYIYICNNPVVKYASPRAEQYRWNFLAYMESRNPFSETLDPERCPETMRQVLAVVRSRRKAGRPVDYLFFGGLYSRLTDQEKRQVLDYIVTEYNVIDYVEVRRKWGSYRKICEMLSTVSGSEYDLAEEIVKEDYRHYYRMIRLLEQAGYGLAEIRKIKSLSLSELYRLAVLFRNEADASPVELAKFLHAPFLYH
ncbi:MAG: transposase [Bacteroidales bacterium]|nr:transposase [Bacteroidales bacterium]